MKCVDFLLEGELTSPEIVICSDSQAALKALASVRVDSSLVLECLQAIHKLALVCNISLIWVPGLSNIPGNMKADELAAMGADLIPLGPEPIVAAPPDLPKRAIGEWLSKSALQTWASCGGLTQSKQLIEGYNKKSSKALIDLKKNQLRAMVGYLKRIGLRRPRLRLLRQVERHVCALPM